MEFFGTIEKLATKEKGIDVDPIHNGKIIRVAIMQVARAAAEASTDPYVNFAFRCRQDNVTVLYVVARGRVNTTLADWVVDDVVRHNYYLKDEDSRYSFVDTKGRTVAACVARLTVSSVRTFKAPGPSS